VSRQKLMPPLSPGCWVQGVEALQEAAEAYLVGLIEDTQVGRLVG
jgi:hypothetical protein